MGLSSNSLVVINEITERCVLFPHVGPGQSPPYPLTSSPLHLLLYLLVFFTFPFSNSFSLHLFSCSIISSHFTRIVPFRFQAGCRRRRLNLALVFWVDFVLCVFLVKDVCLFLSYLDLVLSCGVIVVFPVVGVNN